MPGPIFIRGDGVDLHPVDEEDLPFLQEVINDPSIWLTLGRARPATLKDEEDFYEHAVQADNQEHLIIATDGEAVGIIGLHDINHIWGTAELGYFLSSDHHGKGYVTEAVGLLSDWAFGHLRIEKLIASVLDGNPASQRVLEKNGYTEEGRLTEFAFVDGERLDLLIYGRQADQ